ncbi:MAG: hypothetical protein BWK79_15200 [Beggiatoa sp. IS2]|nr:MAG: hypothetical protein BWK79_15200 [Beggiatoa sp. IS2]
MSNEIISHTFNGIVITQRPTDGYINLTAMCQACGKRFGNYNQLSTTEAFLKALSSETGIATSELIQIVKGGFPELQGTFGHPYAAIHLAQWLSPDFAVKVTKWVFDWLTTGVNPVQAPVALDTAIREVCGLLLDAGQTAQHYGVDIVEIARELGLKSSVGGDLVTKMDVAEFWGVKLSKISYYFRKYREYLNPVKLNHWQRQAMGSRATHMKAYPIHEALRVTLGMDSVMGIKLKERLFGPIGILAKPDTRIEIHWEARLSEVANGLGFYHNYQLGPYRVDFFISSLGVVLECNGFEHHYYDAEKEREREQFITQKYGLVRFDHTVSLEKLVNAILRVKPGEIIRLFETNN